MTRASRSLSVPLFGILSGRFANLKAGGSVTRVVAESKEERFNETIPGSSLRGPCSVTAQCKVMSGLYTAPFALITALVVASLLAALELGHWLSRRAPIGADQASTLAGAILATVGLLLAFSFSMAGDRHALRRAAAVQEVNAIGTFWLRTSLLPEPIRSETRSRLRRYVDLHLEHRLARIDENRTRVIEAEAERLQREIWALLIEDARREPEASRLRLLMPALNTMIDDTGSALAARENRLPDAIFLYLFLLVVMAGVVGGYCSSGEKRNWVLWVIFTMVVSGVLLTLVDMDRPRRGLIQTDAALYQRLRKGMQNAPP